MNEQATKVAQSMLSRAITDPNLAKHLPNLKVSRHIMASVRDAMLVAPILYDLKYKLIVNASTCAFTTSDAPVVIHNQFLPNGLVTEGFSHFVTSMTAPVASGWSGRRVGLAPTGKRRLVTAHTPLQPMAGRRMGKFRC